MDDSVSKHVSEPVSKHVRDVHEVEDIVDKESVKVNKKKEKTTTSDCWKFFTKIGVVENGKERAQCNG